MKLSTILAILCISTSVLPALNSEHFLTTNDPDYVLDTLAQIEAQKNDSLYLILYSLRNQAARLTDNEIFSLAEILKLHNTTAPTTAYYNTLIKDPKFQALQEKIYQLSIKKNVLDRALSGTKTGYERTAIIALLLETILQALSLPEHELARTAPQHLAHFEKELNKLTSSETVNDAIMALDLDPANIIGYLKKLAEASPQTKASEPKKEDTSRTPAAPVESSDKKVDNNIKKELDQKTKQPIEKEQEITDEELEELFTAFSSFKK